MPARQTIEYYGVGQSGYTAGRGEHDPALERELQPRNALYPRNDAFKGDQPHELETDERWTGRGGPFPGETTDE